MGKTVVFDFDGVIHAYTHGWTAPHIIDDEPVPGIKEAIDDIRKAGYEVVVVSVRCGYTNGVKAIRDWLHKYDIYVDQICSHKPPAICYIDDRAITFDGHPENLLTAIETFVPWNKDKKQYQDKEA